MHKYTNPSLKQIKAVKLVGISEQAPGLKTRHAKILRTALGLDAKSPVTFHMVNALQSHPNPTVAATAKKVMSAGYPGTSFSGKNQSGKGGL